MKRGQVCLLSAIYCALFVMSARYGKESARIWRRKLACCHQHNYTWLLAL